MRLSVKAAGHLNSKECRMFTWDFKKNTPGAMPARSGANAIRSTEDLEDYDLLVREAIQNSADERRKDAEDGVTIKISKKNYTGNDKLRLIEKMGFEQILERVPNFEVAAERNENWYRAGLTELKKLNDPSEPLPMLFYEDFNANGLTGIWNRQITKTDRFFTLVLSLGRSMKQTADDSAEALGSYGIGKQAFAICSPLRVVGYYSKFLADDASNLENTRLMLTGFFPDHSVDDIDYPGHAYWGLETGNPEFTRSPVVGSEADKWIEDISWKTRGTEDTGLTVLLPGCNFDLANIRDSIERWWWPRFVTPDASKHLNIILEQDGSILHPPNPASRREFVNVIDCYKTLASQGSGEGFLRQNISIPNVKGSRGEKSGRLAIKAVGDEELSYICLTREGLVIKYDQTIPFEGDACVQGVFEPFSDNLKAFVYSEPEAHHVWNPNLGRLKDLMPWGVTFIERTLKSIKDKTRSFQKSLQEKPKGRETEIADFIDKTLGQLFKPRKKGPPIPPNAQVKAYSIQVKNRSRSEGQAETTDSISYALKLSEHVSISSVPVVVSLSAKVETNAGGASGSEISSTLVADGEYQYVGDAKNKINMNLTHEEVVLSATAATHESWSTTWDIQVEKADD